MLKFGRVGPIRSRMDRRLSPRKEIHLYCEAGGRPGETVNLSNHGVLVRLAAGTPPPRVGERLDLRIEMPLHRDSATRWLCCSGRVARVAVHEAGVHEAGVHEAGVHVAMAIERAQFSDSKDIEMQESPGQSAPRAPA
jgi:hypothetical protein